ncbi:MAG: hypothetical protein KAX05_12525 [Bacteroidales bacterium]|nr:hypothetical protein [Bacteroidales bacterium]
MKNNLLIAIVFFFINNFFSYTQTANNLTEVKKKIHRIGIQYNPYIDENLFSESIGYNVFALRYGYLVYPGLSVGPEFSGYFGKAPYTKLHTFNYGCFCRYSFLSKKKIQPFIEISPYYSFFYQKVSSPNFNKAINDNYFSGYIAPGISGYFLQNKMSFDLFYKFSNRTFLNNKKQTITYRFNIHF